MEDALAASKVGGPVGPPRVGLVGKLKNDGTNKTTKKGEELVESSKMLG